jgi:copper chaperone CopZ
MQEREVRIDGMSSQTCVMTVRESLQKVPGITLKVVRVGAVVFSADDPEAALDRVRSAITSAGYTPTN